MLTAKAGLGSPPLGYAGRALQDYHNDSSLPGTRIERADILPSLMRIEISFTASDAYSRGIECTDIVALEFIYKNSIHNTVLGTKYHKAKRRTPKTLTRELKKYEDDYTSEPSPFHGHGVRVFFGARSLSGFILHMMNIEPIQSV
ncbi:hypothetical protein BJX64DRAFT_261647 [Aspergillus heterothallicus]